MKTIIYTAVVVFLAGAGLLALPGNVLGQGKPRLVQHTVDSTAGIDQTSVRFTLGDVDIETSQAKTIGQDQTASVTSTLVVKRGDAVVQQVSYAAAGSDSPALGLTVPKAQPVPNYFIALKNDGAVSRLLLVNLQGRMWDLAGGAYFLSRDGRYLISDGHAQGGGLTIFDLTRQQIVVELEHANALGLEDLPLSQAKRYWSARFGFICTAEEKPATTPGGKRVPQTVYALEPASGQFRAVARGIDSVSDAEPLEVSFDSAAILESDVRFARG